MYKTMKINMVLVLLLFSSSMYSQSNDFITLWPGKVPGEIKGKQPPVIEEEKSDIVCIKEITDPKLEVFLPAPEKSNGSAIIICPGGGYNILAYDKEGTEIAQWLTKLGYTAFVLQYRIPQKRDGALQDLQRAIRVVRSKVNVWGINQDKIGVMGFSAGGSLSARASCLYNTVTYVHVDDADKLSCRPDFTILIYPAYLDQGPDRGLTPELVIGMDVPPVFIFQTADDVYGNSALVMAGALRDAGLSVELHLLPNGGHGYGLRPGTNAGEIWPVLTENWLKRTLK